MAVYGGHRPPGQRCIRMARPYSTRQDPTGSSPGVLTDPPARQRLKPPEDIFSGRADDAAGGEPPQGSSGWGPMGEKGWGWVLMATDAEPCRRLLAATHPGPENRVQWGRRWAMTRDSTGGPGLVQTTLEMGATPSTPQARTSLVQRPGVLQALVSRGQGIASTREKLHPIQHGVGLKACSTL